MKKQEHWCLRWAEKNMTQMTAIMILLDQNKTDLECLDKTLSLLKSNDYYVSVNSILHENKYDAYLYYDSNNNNWIRSGKVTGRGFTLRHNKHEKLAHCKRLSSKFYIRYPTKTSIRKNSSSRIGYFDNLKR